MSVSSALGGEGKKTGSSKPSTTLWISASLAGFGVGEEDKKERERKGKREKKTDRQT